MTGQIYEQIKNSREINPIQITNFMQFELISQSCKSETEKLNWVEKNSPEFGEICDRLGLRDENSDNFKLICGNEGDIEKIMNSEKMKKMINFISQLDLKLIWENEEEKEQVIGYIEKILKEGEITIH